MFAVARLEPDFEEELPVESLSDFEEELPVESLSDFEEELPVESLSDFEEESPDFEGPPAEESFDEAPSRSFSRPLALAPWSFL